MSPLPVARRRAEAFHDALQTGAATGGDARTAELLVLISALRGTTAPEARPEFVADLRGRLVLTAETELRPAEATSARSASSTRAPVAVRPPRERRLAAALAGFALVGASTTMAVAAQSSLPGDTLYPLKRAIEDADATLRSDDGEGRRLLEHASSRLVELRQVADPGRDPVRAPVLQSTLDTFVEQAEQGSVALLEEYAETQDPRTVVRLQTFAASSLQRLGRLEPVLPAAVRPELVQAARVLLRIDSKADRACPECTAGGVVELPSTLVSATSLDPVAAPVDPATVPAATAPTPGRPSAGPGRGGTRQPSGSPSSRPAPAPQPPATPPTTPPTTAPSPSGPRPPDQSVPKPPTAPKPPAPSPTRDGIVGGLVDSLTGGGGTDPGAPTPSPPGPDLGGLLEDPLGGLGSPTGTLLP